MNQSQKEKGALAWMAGNSVASNLFMAVLLIGGLIIGVQSKQEVFPEFDLDLVVVSVAYPGASPEEVERGIVLAVEEAIQGLDGIDEIRSTASEGRATITVEAIEGTNIEKLSREMESEVDRISSFPDEAETPEVSTASHKREVISYALYGNQTDAVLRESAEGLRDMFLQNPGITQVELDGVRDYEIQVEVPQESLRRYGLTLADVAQRISNASVELPGGSLKTDGGEIMIRIKDRRDLARDYARIPIITLTDGSRILLEDIGQIREDFAESDRFATFNGKPAIILEVYRIGKQKPTEVSSAAKEVVAEFKENLPAGIQVDMYRDMSDIFQQRADLLLKNGYLGLALVFIFLALFLDIRLAFWVSLGIPISFLGSFLILPMTGFTINMVTMFAFIITLGIVVDDAIVVGENIYYKRQEGIPFLRASIEGAREIAIPVTFSILTNIVAFMPILFVPGRMGKIFKLIPVVVIVVFVVSLIECLFILPAHLAHQKKAKTTGFMARVERKQQRFSLAFTSWVKRCYGPFLRIILNYRYITFAIGIAILLTTAGYVMSGRMGMTLFPTVESDYAFATATVPYGTSLNKTRAVQKTIVNAAQRTIDENGGETLSRGILARINDNIIKIRINLTAPEVRPMGTEMVTQKWRIATGDIPGLENLVFQSDRGGPGSGSGMTIELKHRNIDTLTAASKELAKELSFFPNVKDIDDGSAQGKQQFDFKLTPFGERYGFQARDVALQIRYTFYGAEALKLQRGRNEVTVRVRLPENARTSENILETLIVRTPDGKEALLTDVVTMERGRAYTSINRRAQKRITSVTANVIPRSEASNLLGTLSTEFFPLFKNKYPGLSYSFQGRQADMQESVLSLISGLLMALLAIYALLAIPFKSYLQPMIIMACIPFGIVGAVIGHLIMGYSLSIMSLFGLVALSGVVVNDSLILIDFTNRKRYDGLTPHDAVLAAGIHRFRPILLTTLTTFAGLGPMIFETSRQARFLIPMALSLGFGILFATLITLILVPTLYLILEDVITLFSGKKEVLDLMD